MEHGEKGVIKWVSARNLYRDDFLYNLKACLKAFGVVALIGERLQKKRPKRKKTPAREKQPPAALPH